MPKRTRTRKPFTRYRRRRSYKRRSRIKGRRRTSLTEFPHTFKRCFNAAEITETTGAFNFVYSIGQLPNLTEFSNLFDQYQITGVKLTFIPNYTSSGITTADTNQVPQMYVAHDKDGGGPVTETDFLQRGIKPRSITRPWSTFVRPTTLKATFGPIANNYTTGHRRQWLDMSITDTPHYGSYFLMRSKPSNMKIDVFATMYIRCKGLR